MTVSAWSPLLDKKLEDSIAADTHDAFAVSFPSRSPFGKTDARRMHVSLGAKLLAGVDVHDKNAEVIFVAGSFAHVSPAGPRGAPRRVAVPVYTVATMDEEAESEAESEAASSPTAELNERKVRRRLRRQKDYIKRMRSTTVEVEFKPFKATFLGETLRLKTLSSRETLISKRLVDAQIVILQQVAGSNAEIGYIVVERGAVTQFLMKKGLANSPRIAFILYMLARTYNHEDHKESRQML